VGLLLSFGASAAVQGIVLTGGAFNGAVFAGSAALLPASVMLASWVPARRATRVSAASLMRS